MLRKINEVLNDQGIEFLTIFLKENAYGVNCGDRIIINLLQCLVPTIIHECLHEIYPDLCESKILTLEAAVYDIMTVRQKRKIFDDFMRRVNDGTKKKKALSARRKR
jgi:hypothetical protein